MHKFILFAIVLVLLSLASFPAYAAPPPNGPPGLERAIIAQEKHSPQLLAVPGVAGTAVGLMNDGRAAIKILAESSGVVGIPASLDGVPVQILVTGKFVALDPPPGKGPPEGKGPKGKEPATTDWWPRPVPIGISTGNALENSAGTIAARVTDGTHVYALSNNHVYARENEAEIGEEILQPGLLDKAYDEASHLGTLHDFVEISFDNGNNLVDAAIAVSTTDDLGNATPRNGYGTPKSMTQIAELGMSVKKFGRTTELTRGTVVLINVIVEVWYGDRHAIFEHQIVVQGRKLMKPFILPGDSGSLLVTHPHRYPVGLLFAGDATGQYGIANEIDNVLNELGVTIDGE